MNALATRFRLMALLLAAVPAAGCFNFSSAPVDAPVQDDDAGDWAAEDSTPDAAPEDQSIEDAAADPDAPESTDPQPGDAPDETDMILGCPPDDPVAGQLYINVQGRVVSSESLPLAILIYLGAFAPLDLLMTTSPFPIAEGIPENDLTFAFDCLDVGRVAYGLVILSDDYSPDGGPDGTAGDLYPTAALVASWDEGVEPQDVADAAAAAITVSSVALLEMAITGLEVDDSGLLMGVVLNGSTGDPIAGAVVECSDPSVTIYYLDDTGTGLTVIGGTSSLGVYIIPGPVALSYVTATYAGREFPQRLAATKGGLVVCISIESLGSGP